MCCRRSDNREETRQDNLSVLPVTDTPLTAIQTLSTQENSKATLALPETKQRRTDLPALRAEVLTTGAALTGDSSNGLQSGSYDGQTITILRVSSRRFIEHREALSAWVQSASPFWLPVVGVCEGTDMSALVMRAIPDIRLNAWLASSASDPG